MRTQILMTAVGLALTGFGVGYPTDLIYYSKLDSVADVTAPQVGAAGTVNGATFQTGMAGNALSVKGNAAATVRVPFATGLASKGCIEFYAKVPAVSTLSYVHSAPALVKFRVEGAESSNIVFEMQYGYNNGVGMCGLCFGAPYVGGATGGFSLSDVLGAKDPNGWHHYRLLWNSLGINADGDALALYIDGTLRASALKDTKTISDVFAALQQPLYVEFGDSDNKEDFLFDEFKVWKTDVPLEDPAPVELPVVSEVTAKQHYPWCGKVDIGYTVAGSTDGLLVKISVKDNDNNVTYEAKTFDVKPTAAAGAHTVVWDATKDGVNKVSKNMVATVSLIVPAE